MTDDHKLPRELVWEGVHLSELAITSLADGQEAILDAVALAHANACEWCAGRLGRTALLAEAVGEAVSLVRPSSVRAPARPVQSPWRALGAGLVVSLLAGMPAMAHAGGLVDYLRVFFTRGVPVLARGGFALATSESVTHALPVVTLAASVLLVVMGLLIARTRSHSVEASAEAAEGSAS